MRNTVMAVGLFVCSLITISSTSAQAMTPGELIAATTPVATSTDERPVAAGNNVKTIIMEALASVSEPSNVKAKSEQPAQKQHIVSAGDTLSSIAARYDTTWKRLYDKNTDIASPDTISVGQKIVIPSRDESLKARNLPAVNTARTVSSRPVANSAGPASQPVSTPRGSSAGNSYYAGYCTWYAKSRRPDMPNNLGNADTWVMRAAAQGFATGSVPRAGAIGQQGMHVVYVERVNANGTVTVSEMNYQGYGVVSSRTVPAGTFHYIY
jgi:surface antigen